MRLLGILLALSFGVQAFAAAPVNAVNDGTAIKAGTYLNTPNGKTVFKNSAGTGIYLHSSQHIQGLEYSNGAVTGNGGNIHIQAPGQIVRLDGNIDVRGLPITSHPSWVTLGNELHGNGGKVTIDAGYLYQNGNIYASGYNGGMVQLNVCGMTMGSTSRIDATAIRWDRIAADLPPSDETSYGNGGRVKINASGNINITKGAHIITAGDTPLASPKIYNLIEISGKAVNMDGVIYAGKVVHRTGRNGLMPIGHGTINLVSTDGNVRVGQDAIIQSDGGTIKIASTQDLEQKGMILNNGQQGTFRNFETGTNGTIGYDAGKISLTAGNLINNTGRLQADGGNASGGFDNAHYGYYHYKGGNGGTIVISAPNINNAGVIRAMGGNSQNGQGGAGGTISFVGANPSNFGVAATLGGQGITPGALGTITAPDPATSTNTLIGIWKKNP